MSYQGSLTKLRTGTEKQVAEAWRLYGLGRITKPQFTQLAAALIMQSTGQAVAIADLALSAELFRLTGQPVAPLGMLPKAYNQGRFEEGIKTLLSAAEAGEDVTDRLSRFALNSPLDAATDAYSEGVSKSKQVEGWVRQMDGDPCQLCRWWWREGQVWNKKHPMQHHKGCQCVQRVVVTEKKVNSK